MTEAQTNHLLDGLLGGREKDERAFLHFANGHVWTYRDTMSLAARMSAVLRDHGVQPGDRVAVKVQKSPEAVALALACVHAGGAIVPLNPDYTAAEVAYFIGDADPAVLVGDPVEADVLAAIANPAGITFLTLGADGAGSLSEFARAASEVAPEPRGADDLAALMYTSGTTGRSKGAELTHDNLLSNARALASEWRFTEDDILLHALPIFHTHGLFVAVNVSLVAGAAMVLVPRFDADEVVRLLPRATAMMGVPTFYTRLLASDRFNGEVAGHIRLFVSGSAPLLAATHAAFEERTGKRILERYGMSETSMITSNPYSRERRAGTVGFPLDGVSIRVCDPDTGEKVVPGRAGVIEVKGPNVFRGYWRMPEKTASEFRPDGYFITGDLGQIDADGYLQIVGRGKDLVISGGFNVYPKEIETEIDALVGVVESAVIGVPHPDFGEGVVAAVVTESEASITESTIIEALAGRLARFKQPKRVVFVDELPRNVMGKVQKNVLRDDYKGMFQPDR